MSTLHLHSPDFATQTNVLLDASFAEQASEYAIYNIGWWLQYYYLPVVAIVGMCGNLLSFLVTSLVSLLEVILFFLKKQAYW